MKRFVLTLALIGAAGSMSAAAFAQTYPTHPPRGPVHVDKDGYLRDSRGNIIDRKANRVVGSNTAQPGPGDYGMPPASHDRMSGVPQPSVAADPPQLGEAVPTSRTPAMRDEYGFMYDSRGNRIDRMGRIISPQTR